MSDEMQIDGTSYISSKRAAQLSGYAQDYIGQLARRSLIEAKRIGGLWYVSMESLEVYKKKAEEYKPEPPISRHDTPEPGTLVFFDGKEYLSAARAAEMTGYAQDYVGQLGRSGKILSQQVGNRWYVEKESILGHKAEKDRLLAAVQRESVGLQIPQGAQKKQPEYLSNIRYSGSGPLLNYYQDDKDLMADTGKEIKRLASSDNFDEEDDLPELGSSTKVYTVPIRRLPTPVTQHGNQRRVGREIALPMPRKSYLPMILGAAATIIIILSIGYTAAFKKNSAYAVNITQFKDLNSLPASVEAAVSHIGDVLELYLTRELSYKRSQTQ